MANKPSCPTAKKGANMPNEEATAKLSTSIKALHMHHMSKAYYNSNMACISSAVV